MEKKKIKPIIRELIIFFGLNLLGGAIFLIEGIYSPCFKRRIPSSYHPPIWYPPCWINMIQIWAVIMFYGYPIYLFIRFIFWMIRKLTQMGDGINEKQIAVIWIGATLLILLFVGTSMLSMNQFKFFFITFALPIIGISYLLFFYLRDKNKCNPPQSKGAV